MDAVNLIRDGWDVAALLEAVDDPDPLIAAVEVGLSTLPERCHPLWARLRTP